MEEGFWQSKTRKFDLIPVPCIEMDDAGGEGYILLCGHKACLACDLGIGTGALREPSLS